MVTDVGANAKMNEFCAIMGLCNLKHLNKSLESRKACYDYYKKHLEDVKGIYFFQKNEWANSNFAYFPILIDEKVYGKTRNEVYDLLKQNDIYARKYFYPATADQACFRNKYRNAKLENARSLSEKVLVLPFYEDMEQKQMDRIIRLIRRER